jgi:hypothetical protein
MGREVKVSDSPLLIDYRKGSIDLALYEPVRSLLSRCLDCSGEINPKTWTFATAREQYLRLDSTPYCPICHDTGRTLSTLPSGDASFYGSGPQGTVSIGVELKEITELISSLISGRLQDTQMRGMLQDYDPGHRWILHYGRYRPSPVDGMIQTWKDGHAKRRAGWYTFKIKSRDKNGNLIEKTIPYGFLEAFKCCSAKEAGFSFDKVETISEASHWLGVLYRTWTRPWHTHKSMKVFDKSQSVRARMRNEKAEKDLESESFYISGKKANNSENEKLINRMAVFSQFPGIGYERAKAAAEHFPTIRHGVNATVDEWSNIETVYNGKVKRSVKIGKEIAKEVVKFVSE